MLGTAGLCLLAVCFVSQCSTRRSVVAQDGDYSSAAAGPMEALVNNMQKVLNRMAAVQAAHPRMQQLYELLRKDLPRSSQQDSRHQLDFNETLRPKYDVNKLIRIYTTEPELEAR